MTLLDSLRRGDRLALARVLTHVENDTPEGRAALQELFRQTGRAHLVGVTGAPGTGKSSLVNQLALQFRMAKARVAIIAIDPTSPFTGGAVLGDRVRMKDLSGDEDVFIRSMASRGALGGLARTTSGVAQVFDAAGYDTVIIETVGAGQGEVEIARLAHTTLVVEAPGLGDDIQAIKAGILEIADVLVVNKADLPGVDNAEKALRSMLELAHPRSRELLHHSELLKIDGPEQMEEAWPVTIVRTVATRGDGVEGLAQKIREHAAYLHASGNWTRREEERVTADVSALLENSLVAQFRAGLPEGRYNEVMRQVLGKQLSPKEAVALLIDHAG